MENSFERHFDIADTITKFLKMLVKILQKAYVARRIQYTSQGLFKE